MLQGDCRPFKAIAQGIDPSNGRSWVIHEGQVLQPQSWHDYFHVSHPLSQEVLLQRNVLRDIREGVRP